MHERRIMPAMATAPELGEDARRFLHDARRAVLATIAADGRPRLVPICHVLLDGDIWTPLDDKPKQPADPLDLARVRDIRRDPRVTVLVDRWDEDWSRLAWLRVEGEATVVEPGDAGHAAAIDALRGKYPQYATHRLEVRPVIRIAIGRVRGWGTPAG
jgi:PPOX class probable F420-dependent enzyme